MKKAFAYYFAYQGRISRSDFWLKFQLPVIVLGIIAMALFRIEYPHFFTAILNPPTSDADIEALLQPINSPVLRAVGVILELIEIPIGISLFFANMRRLHDRNHSAWFMLVGLIPFIGPIWLLIELGFLKGTDGPNRYGPDPVS